MQKDIAERLKDFPTLVKLAMLGDVVSAQAIEVFSRDAMLEIEALRGDVSRLWQPIDTAPRDGTTVDCWVGTSRLENCFFGKPYHECLSEYCDSCPDDLEVECWRWSFGNEPVTPTHWMRPPAAPLT